MKAAGPGNIQDGLRARQSADTHFNTSLAQAGPIHVPVPESSAVTGMNDCWPAAHPDYLQLYSDTGSVFTSSCITEYFILYYNCTAGDLTCASS